VLDVTEVRVLRRRLLAWYDRHRRDLPWRRTGDPYAVWVSEVMLQQTTVAAAAPRYERFLARFPTPASLAAAGEEEVLAEWAGLGYYGRARRLRQAAREIAAGGGAMPRTVDGLRALPGVGAYTAAAVASIAFGVRCAAVDANAERVIGRLLGVSAAEGARRIAEAADALVPPGRPGDFNQALMDLGTAVCLPRAPLCQCCPLREGCRARREGLQDALAFGKPRVAPVRLRLAAGFARRGERLVLCPDAHLVRGHLGLPMVQVPLDGDAEDTLRAAWPALTGRVARRLSPVSTLRHSVLERRYRVELFRVVEGRDQASSARPVLAEPAALATLAHGGLLRKALAVLFPRAG